MTELKKEMNSDYLKKTISWLSTFGIHAYTYEIVSRDLNITLDPALINAQAVLKTALIEALNSAKLIAGIETAKTADDLFDLILTFLEELSIYHADFQIMFSTSKINVRYIELAPVLDIITSTIFSCYINTFLDKITYNILMGHIFYAWLNDHSEDLSSVSHTINHTVKNILDQN